MYFTFARNAKSMSISLSVSSVLIPRHSSVTCTYDSHQAIIRSLQRIAEVTNSPLCKSIAYVSDFYGDIDLVELPDSVLYSINSDLKNVLDVDDPAICAITETLDERLRYRSALPEQAFLCALLRNEIRTKLEIECGGKLYDS